MRMGRLLPATRIALAVTGGLVLFTVGLYFTCRDGLGDLDASLTAEMDDIGRGGGPIWHADPAHVPPRLGGWSGNWRPFFGLVMLDDCEARNVPAERSPESPTSAPAVLHLLADGSVIFQQRQFPLPRGTELDLRAQAQAESSLHHLAVALDAEDPDVPRVRAIHVRGDCRAPWGSVRLLLRLIRERPRDRERMAWLVARPAHGSGLEMRASLAPLEGTRSPVDLELTLRTVETGAVEIESRLGVFRFPVGCLPRMDTPRDVLLEGNRIWLDFERALERLPAPRSAVVRTAPAGAAVPLAYPLTVFDFLIGRGILDVRLPDEDVRFTFVAPLRIADGLPAPHTGVAERFPAWFVVLLALGMTLAFGVSLPRSA